ncbi:LysR family transcriptional regulator [Tardiphaga sp. 839_C3_N1_4]|uniref:LysR family transcriptional regulator n=1 Tax=Tardiphaga sp. 839_C3_N1_4 TaxID=3240761 RepID=UPI003F204A22
MDSTETLPQVGFTWDDLRVVLAIETSGTALGAARRLGVSHSTVLRRLATLELALDTKLFQRSEGRMVVSPPAAALLAKARSIAEALDALPQLIDGPNSDLDGVVRLAAPHALICHALTDALANFRETHPAIRIALCADMQFDEFRRGHADVALRISLAVPNELGIRRLCDYRYALYARNDLAQRMQGGATLAEMPFILLSDASRDMPERKWMVSLTRGRAPAIEASSTVSLRAAVASGLGVGVLPCYVGDAVPGVTRIEMGPAAPREGIYLITHPTQSKLARSRAVADFLIKFATRNRHMFSGLTQDY